MVRKRNGKVEERIRRLIAGLTTFIVIFLTSFGVITGIFNDKLDREVAVITTLADADVSSEQINVLLDFAIALTDTEGASEGLSESDVQLSYDAICVIAEIGEETQAKALYSYGYPRESKRNAYKALRYKDCAEKAGILAKNLENMVDQGGGGGPFPINEDQIKATSKALNTLTNNVKRLGVEKYVSVFETIRKATTAEKVLDEVSIKEAYNLFQYCVDVTEGIDATDLYVLDVAINTYFRENVTPGLNEILKIARAIDKDKFWEIASELPDGISFVHAFVRFSFLEAGADMPTLSHGIYTILSEHCWQNDLPQPYFGPREISSWLNRLLELSEQNESEQSRLETEEIIDEISRALSTVFIKE